MASITGGDKLGGALEQILTNLKKASAVQVGFFEDQEYPDGTLVAAVAADNEWGTTRTVESEDGETTKTVHTPPRPFFRNAIANNQAKWPINLNTALKANNYDAEIALGLVGQEIQEEVTESILDFSDPPNAPSTIARKGFDDPLVEDGTMARAPRHRVIK